MKALLDEIDNILANSEHPLKQVRLEGAGSLYVEYKGVMIFAKEEFLRKLEEYINGL